MEEKKKQIKAKISKKVEQGVYANAVSVNFNNNECIIDFAYQLPNMQEPTIKIVSRVNMSHRTAESFLNVLSNSMLDWKNKTKEKPE